MWMTSGEDQVDIGATGLTVSSAGPGSVLCWLEHSPLVQILDTHSASF